MGDVEHAAQLMLQLMGGPVVGYTTARQAVVGDTTTPHNLGALAVVLGVLQHIEDSCFHAAQHGLSQVGGEVHVIVFCKIALHGVHHHVGDASSRLVRR